MSFLKAIRECFNNKIIKTIYIIDVLYMKDINAVYGFESGDFVLKQLHNLIKNKIKNEIREVLDENIVIEIKNTYVDVFTITIYEDLSNEKIVEIKNVIFDNIISSSFELKKRDIKIDINITLGCSKGDDNNLLIYAEKALHSAKLNYLHFMYYDSKLYKNRFVNEELLVTLHENIKNNSVEPFFQGIYCNKTNKTTKYEALMRIYDRDGNIILPNAFISKARRYRLFNKLMEILILKVLDYIKKYKIHVSINLDYNDILNTKLKNLIIENIKNSDIGKYLTIEILESKKISNYYVVNEFINSLKEYNVQIAVDDFGTGFSNYEHILNINTDYIKLDGSLVKKLGESMYYNLVKSIVQFCKEQNIKVVAEFVSDLKIQRYVKSLDIDYSQGYYISKPQTIDKIIGRLNNEK